jgi:hypothetical protein
LFGPTLVEGVRIELVSAIMELLATSLRGSLGMLDFRLALILRLSAGEQEITSALGAMEGAGLIEWVLDDGSVTQWQLRTVPAQRASPLHLAHRVDVMPTPRAHSGEARPMPQEPAIAVHRLRRTRPRGVRPVVVV